jgi:alpha-maltose-1-phosphate synthase
VEKKGEVAAGGGEVSRILLTHPGTQHSHRLARVLEECERLGAFHTGFALVGGEYLDRLVGTLPGRIRRLVANRRLEGVPPTKLTLHPWAELCFIGLSRLGFGSQSVFQWRNRVFQQGIPTDAIRRADAVIGFDTLSWLLATRCRKLGVPFILDQSIAHLECRAEAYQCLAEEFPEWPADLDPADPGLVEAQATELDCATRIAVASRFTRDSLIRRGVDPGKLVLHPYGVDARRFVVRRRRTDGTLRFVFAGSLSARKGIPQLLRVWRKIADGRMELWLAGPVSREVRGLVPDLPGLKVLGSVPHRELPAVLGQCDVFVFPSYFEGFGLVLLEAMACGLPILTTPATAGPELLEDPGATHETLSAGAIVPIGDDERLIAAMLRYKDQPDLAYEEGRRAREIAETRTWSAYREQWLRLVGEGEVKKWGSEEVGK